MAAARQYLCSRLLRRKRPICQNLVTSRGTKYYLLENNDSFLPIRSALSVSLAAKCEKKPKSPNERKNHLWREHGYEHWTDAQFKKRLRVSRDTFQFLLHTIADYIKKETTPFKKPTSPELQLALTLYRLSHGCTYATVGDQFDVGTSTACTIFISVVKTIVKKMYDNFVVSPKNEKELKAELTLFLEDWEFPCVGAWDGFHVYINSHLKTFSASKSVIL